MSTFPHGTFELWHMSMPQTPALKSIQAIEIILINNQIHYFMYNDFFKYQTRYAQHNKY